jgi:hypothetical protein
LESSRLHNPVAKRVPNTQPSTLNPLLAIV